MKQFQDCNNQNKYNNDQEQYNTFLGELNHYFSLTKQNTAILKGF